MLTHDNSNNRSSHFSVTDATESQLVKELGQDRPVAEGGGGMGAQNDLNVDCLLLNSVAHHARGGPIIELHTNLNSS